MINMDSKAPRLPVSDILILTRLTISLPISSPKMDLTTTKMISLVASLGKEKMVKRVDLVASVALVDLGLHSSMMISLTKMEEGLVLLHSVQAISAEEWGVPQNQ